MVINVKTSLGILLDSCSIVRNNSPLYNPIKMHNRLTNALVKKIIPITPIFAYRAILLIIML